ncbi:hypothetical protein LTR15_001928 [Elasticomyces elasticus]|nr:hypothetical protein LTR15_001928 [Elasticomyces elasticus]
MRKPNDWLRLQISAYLGEMRSKTVASTHQPMKEEVQRQGRRPGITATKTVTHRLLELAGPDQEKAAREVAEREATRRERLKQEKKRIDDARTREQVERAKSILEKLRVERVKREEAVLERLRLERTEREKIEREEAERAAHEKSVRRKAVHKWAERQKVERRRALRARRFKSNSDLREEAEKLARLGATRDTASSEGEVATFSVVSLDKALPASSTKECGVCIEDIVADECIEIVPTGDVVCVPCFLSSIQPLFESALKYEHAWPVAWGKSTLDALDFSDFLPKDFTAKWIFKLREYARPTNEKVYCQHLVLSYGSSQTALDEAAIKTAVDNDVSMHECGRFLGSTLPPTDAMSSYGCTACQGSTCGICLSSFFGDSVKHVCIDVEDTSIVEDDPYQAMKRGKDYQFCPRCSCAVELEDGCNYMRCRCGDSFCFICGEKLPLVETLTDHFVVGMSCPKWNQPTDTNAHHEPDPIDEAMEAALDELEPERLEVLYRLDDFLPVVRQKALIHGEDLTGQTWTLLARLITKLRFTMQYQFIVDVLARQSRHFLHVRSEYSQRHEVIGTWVKEINENNSHEHRSIGKLNECVTEALQVFYEQHESFILRLDQSITAISAEEELETQKQSHLAKLKRQLLHDPKTFRIIEDAGVVFADVPLKQAQDPVNAGLWTMVARLAWALNLVLQVPALMDILPGTMETLRSLRARYLKAGNVIEEVSKKLLASETAVLDQRLTTAELLYRQKHDTVLKQPLTTARYIAIFSDVRAKITASFAERPENLHVDCDVDALAAGIIEGLKVQYALDEIICLSVESVTAFRASYREGHVAVTKLVGKVFNQPFTWPSTLSAGWPSLGPWAQALSAYHERHDSFIARIELVILMGAAQQFLSVTFKKQWEKDPPPMNLIGDLTTINLHAFGHRRMFMHSTQISQWATVYDMTLLLIQVLQFHSTTYVSQQSHSTLVAFLALYKQVHAAMISTSRKVDTDAALTQMMAGSQMTVIATRATVDLGHEPFLDRLKLAIGTAKAFETAAANTQLQALSNTLEAPASVLQVPLGFQKPTLYGMWTADAKETQSLWRILSQVYDHAEEAAKSNPCIDHIMQHMQALATVPPAGSRLPGWCHG